jgi:pimeloyl-ACP methyl ester carboxylesterase
VQLSSSIDGFRLAYHRLGSGVRSVVLLHGWPGDHTDFRYVAPLLADEIDVVAPDLRGFGASDKHRCDPAEAYSATAQARSIAALIEELGLRRPVVAGYDIGSRIAQALARQRPDLVRALVLSPPLPGIGDRVLTGQAQREFWYQAFHQLPLAEVLLDGQTDAVRKYLRHFWDHWSGPQFAVAAADLDHLVAAYSSPGAFTASIAWYRAGAGSVATSLAERPPRSADRITTPTAVLWQDHDPLFPRAWSDRLTEFFADVSLHPAEGVGHFTPVECPDRFAALIRQAFSR